MVITYKDRYVWDRFSIFLLMHEVGRLEFLTI